MKRTLFAAVVVLALAFSHGASLASPPPRWSFDRASLGLSAQGAIFNAPTGETDAFLPGAYLSYDLTSQMSVASTVERDFATSLTIGKAGFRFKVMESDRGTVALGVNLVGYGDDGADKLGIVKPTSWDAVVNGAWAVARKEGQTLVWGTASAGYDSQNDLKTFKIGLRYQLIGGRPE